MLSFVYLLPIIILSAVVHQINSQGYYVGVNSNVNLQKKAMPESSSFIEMLSKSVFVDKTLFIRDYLMLTRLNPPWYDVILCPPGWGKTTTLDMLKTFLEIQFHPNGSEMVPISKTPNYELFTKGEYHYNGYDIKLEKPLQIANFTYRKGIDEFLGQLPVIWLSFNGFSSTPEDGYIAKLTDIVIQAFQKHKYLIQMYDQIKQNYNEKKNVTELAQSDKEQFIAYLNNDRNKTNGLQDSISFLIEKLHQFYEKEVQVFIDDYDEIFHATHIDEIHTFLDRTISSCEPHAIIIAATVPRSFYGEYTTLREYLNTPHPFYGYLQQEMDEIYQYYRTPEHERNLIRYWYGGYQNMLREIYNPRSIHSYITHRQFKSYWVNKNLHKLSLNDALRLPELQLQFGRLITGHYYDLRYSTIHDDRAWKHFKIEDIRQAFAYLNLAGYITRTDCLPHEATYVSRYVIPNFENVVTLQTAFAEILKELYQPDLYDLLTKTSNALERFLLGDDLTSDELSGLVSPSFQSMIKYLKDNLNHTANATDAFAHTVIMSVFLSKELHFINWQFADLPEEPEHTRTTTTKKPQTKLFVSKKDKKTTKKPESRKKPSNLVQRPTIVLSSNTRGFVIEVKQVKAVQSPANRTSYYFHMFEKYPEIHGWRDVKFIYFNMLPTNSVVITSVLDSVDRLRIQTKIDITTIKPTTKFIFKAGRDV